MTAESKTCAMCKGPNALSNGLCKECQAAAFHECECEMCKGVNERGS